MLRAIIYVRKKVDIMSTITVRLNKEEEKAFRAYAELLNTPLSTLFKQVMEEKLEDEFDMKAILAYEEQVKNNEVKLYSHEDVLDIRLIK